MKSMMTLALVAAAACGAFRMADEDDDPTALLKKSGYTLSEAIAKASKEAAGLTAVSAELEDEDGKIVYAVEFVQGDKVLEILLDAKTGELVKKETESEDKSGEAKALKVTLAQAIENALVKMPGLAFAAEVEIEDGKAEIEVKILSDGKVHKVEVDATTGTVLKVKTKKGEGEKKDKKEDKDEKDEKSEKKK